MQKSVENKTIFFPGLNGLRAIAALGVLFSHITSSLGIFNVQAEFGGWLSNTREGLLIGGFGVSMFFALSGFLITYLLLREQELQELNMKHFYMRRILRIWPLYYTYIALVLIVLFIYRVDFDIQRLTLYIFLMANIPYIIGANFPWIEHYWSLGVEEQFYLFWPWIVKLCRKKILFVVIALCALLVVLKTAFRYLDIAYSIDLPYKILHVTRFHCMLFGALGAIFFHQKNELFLRITTHVISQTMAWSVILLIIINKYHLISFLDNEIVSLSTVVIIMGQIGEKQKIINLDNKICDFFGKISFGIYVIHPVLIFLYSKLLFNLSYMGGFKVVLVYLLVCVSTILLAHISYNYFEKFFMTIKSRYTIVKSSGFKT